MHEKAAKLQALARGVEYRAGAKIRLAAAIRIEARWKGIRARKRTTRMNAAALVIQKNWLRFHAQVHIKMMLFERMHNMKERYNEILREKVTVAAVEIMQRNWRRQRDYQKSV